MDKIRVLAVGDVVGKPGRTACQAVIPRLRREQKIDFVIANGENLAGGSGITEATAGDLFHAGVDVITSGDHVFKKKETLELLSRHERILRPANYPKAVSGQGSVVVRLENGLQIGVMNLIGRVFLKTVDCPFETAFRLTEEIRRKTPVMFVDMHAEATSEKVAMGWYLDGKASGVFGTHTHIQTADECILPQGTGYITDLGMCGPYRSVIGRDVEQAVQALLLQIPQHLEVAKEDIRFCGILFDVDAGTGKTLGVQRIQEKVNHGNS